MRRLFYAFVTFIRSILRIFGADLIRYKASVSYIDSDEVKSRIFDSVRDYTMTSPERIDALIEAVKYIVRAKIDGAFVECGVWKGGSVMTMALTLKEMGEVREIYLYDTFSGMSAPSAADADVDMERFSRGMTSETSSKWLCVSVEEVEKNISGTGYPGERWHFVKGRVEDTIPETVPQKIALLRLDTDFYSSTRHELIHLFPLLSPGGVIIIDDYGRWPGAKKAVDEYISENKLRIFLNRIDDQGRIAVKLPD